MDKAILYYLGGAAAVANIAHCRKGWVYRWFYTRDQGGCDGLIPAKYQFRLLTHAKKHNIDLRPDDFFYPERLQAIIAANPDKYPSIKRGRKRGRKRKAAPTESVAAPDKPAAAALNQNSSESPAQPLPRSEQMLLAVAAKCKLPSAKKGKSAQ